jgi:glyoxylase-like metal-dependent hydrolase (beta-lactamase superfamily II)
MHPGDVRTTPVELELLVDGQNFSLREISGPDGHPSTETTLILHDRIAEQSAIGQPFKELPKDQVAKSVTDTSAWLPSSILSAAKRAAPTCRANVSVGDQNGVLHTFTFADGAGRAFTVFLDKEHRVSRIENLAAHPRLGDVCNWTQFREWEKVGNVSVPRKLSRFITAPSVAVRYDLTLVDCKPGSMPESSFLLPAAHQTDIPTWGQVPAPELEYIQLAPTLWSVEVAASNSRIMVIEREKDLVLLGAPDDDAVCGSLITAFEARFAGKPIGLVAFSHHHPSPSGGLRALAATGATVLAPAALEFHVKQQLSRPTSLGMPAVAGPEQPRIQTFEHETTIEAGDATVRIIDIAEKSAHAFSYSVFYFPQQGILVEDDLGYFPTEGAARVSPRLLGLVDAIEALHIEPKHVIQGWPVRNARRDVDWSVVTDLVRAVRDKNKPADK